MTQTTIAASTVGQEIKTVLSSAMRARSVRACVLYTRDREHALHLIRESVVGEERGLYHYSVAMRRKWNQKAFRFETCGGASHDPAELLRSSAEIRGGALVVIEDLLNTLCDERGDKTARQQLALMLSSEKANDGTVLLFLEPPQSKSSIPSILAGAFTEMDLPMPRRDEVRDMTLREVTVALADAGQNDPELAREWTEEFTPELTGLTRTTVVNSIRDALAENGNDFASAKNFLSIRKKTALSSKLAMEVLEPSNEVPLGMERLYDYLRVKAAMMQEPGIDRPRGIILVGPPGTGKSMLAQAAGSLFNLSVVKFEVGRLMNSYVGKTEQNFLEAFDVLSSMSPSVVFMDEFEKAFASSGTENDGGTMMRATGSLLTWLSDNKNPNFIIATSNNLKRLGEMGNTLTRSGRFDKLFFCDVPTRSARAKMLDRWLTGHVEEKEGLAEAVADATPKFSGADLRAVLTEAYHIARYKSEPMGLDLIMQQVKLKENQVMAIYQEFSEIRSFGELRAEPAGLSEE